MRRSRSSDGGRRPPPNASGVTYAERSPRMTLARPSSAMSRETVAWVTSNPSDESSATRSPWLAIGWSATRRRMAAWRSRFTSTAVTRAGPGAVGDARAERPVVEGAGQRLLRGAVGDDRLGALPGERRQGGPDLGHHAAADRAVGDQRLGLGRGDRVELGPVRSAHAVHVGHQHELPCAEAGREPGGRVVRVDVAHQPLLVARERGHHRDLPGDEQRVDEVAPDAGDRGHEPDVGDALADQQAAVDTREPHRVAARVVERGHELAVDHARAAPRPPPRAPRGR